MARGTGPFLVILFATNYIGLVFSLKPGTGAGYYSVHYLFGIAADVI